MGILVMCLEFYERHLIVDDAVITASVTGDVISGKRFNKLAVTVNTGTITSSPTLVVAIEVQDKNGNWTVYAATDTIKSSTSTILEVPSYAAGPLRVKATLGGSGSFGKSTIELHLKG